MSKDGKTFSFSSNFDTPPGLAKFDTSEDKVSLLRADDKHCIYEYNLEKDSSEHIVVTGCENEIRELQIQRRNSAPFYGRIHPDGKVDEVELPMKKDTAVYLDDFEKNKNTNKTKGFKGLKDDITGGIGMYRQAARNAQFPPCMDLELYLYYGPSFEHFTGGNAEARAMRIATHAKNHYLHPEFPTKINVITTVKRLGKDFKCCHVEHVRSLVPKENLKKGRLHALLIGGEQNGGSLGGK